MQNEGTECPVCFDSKTNLHKLQCSHELCQDCSNKWFCKAETCPICRAPVVTSGAVHRVLLATFPDVIVPMVVIQKCLLTMKVTIVSPTLTQLTWTYNGCGTSKISKTVNVSSKYSQLLHSKVSDPRPSVETIVCACVISIKQICCVMCALSSNWECIHSTA